MSFFGFLILVLIGYFVIWPIVKVAMRVRSAQRQFRDAMVRHRHLCRNSGFAGVAPWRMEPPFQA